MEFVSSALSNVVNMFPTIRNSESVAPVNCDDELVVTYHNDKTISIGELRRLIIQQNWQPDGSMCKFPGREWSYSEDGPVMPCGKRLWSELGGSPVRYSPKFPEPISGLSRKELEDLVFYYEPWGNKPRYPFIAKNFMYYGLSKWNVNDMWWKKEYSSIQVCMDMESAPMSVKEFLVKVLNRELQIDICLVNTDLFPLSKFSQHLQHYGWIQGLGIEIPSVHNNEKEKVLVITDNTMHNIVMDNFNTWNSDNIDMRIPEKLLHNLVVGNNLTFTIQRNDGYIEHSVEEHPITKIKLVFLEDGFRIIVFLNYNYFTISYAKPGSYYSKNRNVSSNPKSQYNDTDVENGGWYFDNNLIQATKDGEVLYQRECVPLPE